MLDYDNFDMESEDGEEPVYTEATLLIRRSLFDSLAEEFLAIASMQDDDLTLLDQAEYVRWNAENEIVLLEWSEFEESVYDRLYPFITTLDENDYHLLEIDDQDKEIEVGGLPYKYGMYAELDNGNIHVRTDIAFEPMNPYNIYVSFK